MNCLDPESDREGKPQIFVLILEFSVSVEFVGNFIRDLLVLFKSELGGCGSVSSFGQNTLLSFSSFAFKF